MIQQDQSEARYGLNAFNKLPILGQNFYKDFTCEIDDSEKTITLHRIPPHQLSSVQGNSNKGNSNSINEVPFRREGNNIFVTAMVNPLWFAERMQGIALVPEPLWWLLGVIVSFYFGARQQVKSQEFQRAIVGTIARVPQVVENIETLREMRADSPQVADTGADSRLALAAVAPSENAALDAWRRSRG